MRKTANLFLRHARNRLQAEAALRSVKNSAKELANIAPLLAAIVAPLSTLYDIPGLTQRWYTYNGTPIDDPPINLALSAAGLAANFLANGLLIFRFSSRKRWWKTATSISNIFWLLKTSIALVNLGVFGAGTRNGPGFHYSDGFWCAASSLVLAGSLSLLLIFGALFSDKVNTVAFNSIRLQARHFLLTELAFFLILALEAFIISRLEKWSFFSGVYFSIVSATTVGFGSDYAPTTTASRILVFPFAVITIAGLAAQVSSILHFFSAQAQARKERWRARYKGRLETGKEQSADDLIAEMQHLEQIITQENKLSRLYDLLVSLISFILFWLVGAAVFSRLEGWSMGTALYFCYCFFLTIGYGDFYPKTSGGRVFFVAYALVAVPVVTSFAVQTITGIMHTIQQKRLEQARVKRGLVPFLGREATISVYREKAYADMQEEDKLEGQEETVTPFISHAELVMRRHQHYRRTAIVSSSENTTDFPASPALDDDAKSMDIQSETQQISREPCLYAVTSPNTERQPACRTIAVDADILDELFTHSRHMDSLARRLIISCLETGSKGQLLLQADHNLMQKAFESHQSDVAELQVMYTPDIGKQSNLEQIHMYREAYACMVVATSRLKCLQGREQLLWERRMGKPHDYGHPVESNEHVV